MLGEVPFDVFFDDDVRAKTTDELGQPPVTDVAPNVHRLVEVLGYVGFEVDEERIAQHQRATPRSLAMCDEVSVAKLLLGARAQSAFAKKRLMILDPIFETRSPRS
jgi:hypothetical protein